MPLIEGYSKATLSRNIAAEVSAGRDQAQAAAIAYRVGRRAWRKRKPGKPYPAHLTEKRAKNMAKKKAAKKTTAKKTTRKKTARKRNTTSKAGHTNYYLMSNNKYWNGLDGFVHSRHAGAVYHDAKLVQRLAQRLANKLNKPVGVLAVKK